MRVFILLSFLFTYLPAIYSQQIDLYKSSLLPAEPYGGLEGIQHLINQQINYPTDEYDKNIGGEAFVLLKVDSLGKLISKKAIGDASDGLKNEALRLSELICWESNKNRERHKVGEEKIKFTFSKKKYDRVARKRGYASAPNSSPTVYSLKQLDSIPKILDNNNLNEFVRKNIKYPNLALQQGISGHVKTEFVIEANGRISNIRIIKAVAGGCNEETIRLLRKANWKPGIKNGKQVRTLFSYTLSFIHPGNTYR